MGTKYFKYVLVILALLLVTSAAGCRSNPTSRDNAPGSASNPTPGVSLTTDPSDIDPTPMPKPSIIPDLSTVDSQTQFSPDGAWRFVVKVLTPGQTGFPDVGEYYYVQAIVERMDRSARWSVDEGWYRYGLGYTWPQLERWSPDGKFLYFLDSAVPDGCSMFGYKLNLRRVDLSNGKIEAVADDVAGTFSLNPGGDAIVSIEDSTLVHRNLADGTLKRIPFEPEIGEWQAGEFVWSPDSTRVLFTVVYFPCSLNTVTGIMLVNLENQTSITVVAADDRQFQVVDWKTAGEADLQDKDGKHWRLNLETGTLTPGN